MIANNFAKTVGQRINVMLAIRGKKQKELAAALNVTDNTVSYYCKGERLPNTKQIKIISEYLECSADYLLGLTNTPTTDRDVSFVCDYTGLSERAVQVLNAYHLIYTENPNPEYEKALNLFVEQASLNNLISYIMTYRSALSNADDIERQYQLLLDKYQFCLKNPTADNVNRLQYPDIDQYKDRLNLSVFNMSELPKVFAKKHFKKR